CPATPLLASETIPEVWYKSALGKLYVVNFTDSPKQYAVKLTDLALDDGCYADLFTRRSYHSEQGVLSLRLDPHDAVCLEYQQ
ncbi:MAG: hypothetical protein II351_04165, partial [Clostridia bacterium]|nr:hypothetical protein [Clostridia bacterium]